MGTIRVSASVRSRLEQLELDLGVGGHNLG